MPFLIAYVLLAIVSLASMIAVWIDGIVIAFQTGPILWAFANVIPPIGFWHGILHLSGAWS